MADVSDVEQAFVGILAAVAYPNGTAQPSITTRLVALSRGWPVQDTLQGQLELGVSIVTVYARPRATRNTTRYPQAWKQTGSGAVTITVAVQGDTVTFGGTGATGQNVGVSQGSFGYVHAVQATDTPTTIATAFAAMIPGATSNGPALTCPAAPTALVEPIVPAIREMRRQEQQVQVTIWSPTPADRDTISAALDAAMSAVDFITLSDGQQARVRYHDTGSSDAAENAALYRRDLTFLVEYSTTQTAQQPTVVFPSVLLDRKFIVGTYGNIWDAWVPDEEPME